MQEEHKFFTDFEGRFNARLSSVLSVRRKETPSETTGISAKYECVIKSEYQKDLMGLLEEGMLLAVSNFKSGNQAGKRYTLLEIAHIGPEHYGLKGLSDYSYYPYQFEIIQQSVEDWGTDDKATMMIQLAAIPLNYDLIIDEDGNAEYMRGFTYPIIGENVHILNKDTIHQMYNKSVLERMGLPWKKVKTSSLAREDPRLGTIKMFESEKEQVPIYVDFERLVRYHFGVFSFTGGGKSNLLSNILRRLVYHTKDTRFVIFDISMEYPFLLQDVFADENVPAKIILETPVTDPDQLFKIVVKARGFEKDQRSKNVFAKILDQDKVGYYIEPTMKAPACEDILNDLQAQRKDAVDKPNYSDAINQIHRNILDYMKKKKLKRKSKIDEPFIDYLNTNATKAVQDFKVSDRSNLYGWATSRPKLKEIIQLATSTDEEAPEGSHTVEEIAGLIEGEERITCLSIVDPTTIKNLAIELTSRILGNRKREFRVDPNILFVFDEAQEFIPAYDKARGIERGCTEQIEILLRQGRKYGLGGCIATQRIAYLNTNALQQLHTYFVGPLPRPYDRSLVSNTFTIDQGILEKTLEFAPGEWLLSSYIATGMENVPIFIKADNAETEIQRALQA